MHDITRFFAEEVVCSNGWLVMMPQAFQRSLLAHALLQRFAAGATIYRHGDPLGGIYGLVTGTVAINSAPQDAPPRTIHMGIPGGWTGEGCFLTGQPRRVELQAVTDIWVLYVPLEAMERMAAHDPAAIRAFAAISVLATDLLVRVVHDLQRREIAQRIAAVLHRINWKSGTPLTLSQDALAEMANASRQQVNVAIGRFAKLGWISTGYRSITVHDATALLSYAERGE